MGNELFNEVTDLTGLPKNLISDELVSILGRVGTDSENVTLEELREAMASYLMEVISTIESPVDSEVSIIGAEHPEVLTPSK